ncbi:MAG: aminotransferase class IV [Bacteroidota bacterium]
MPLEDFICYNGQFIKKKEKIFDSENRAFRYGDGVFETIRVAEKNIFFFKDHFQRLTSGMEILGFTRNPSFSLEAIADNIIKLLNINRLFQGARIRLSVFRTHGGFYTPESNEFEYVIEVAKLQNKNYILNQKGLIIDIYKEHNKPIGILSNIKSSNALLYVLASKWKRENNFDDCLLINENGNIVEATSSNLFIVKDNILITPSLLDGCVDGIIRNHVIDIALSLKFVIYDEANVKESDIIEADEIFITNSINGIQWIVAYKNKRYFNKLSKLFIDKLNKVALINSFQDQQEH